MAETMEAILVPVPMGTLTDEDYEALIAAAMPSFVKTEVAEAVVAEIAAEPEKPVDPIVVAVEPAKPKKRVCSKCGHTDGNSVGKIKLALLVEVVRDRLKLWGFEPICNICAERMPPEERRRLMKIGALYGIVGVRNAAIHAQAAAVDYWKAVVAAKAEPLQARRDESGKVLCGVPGCKLCRNEGLATRFAIVKNAEGKYEVAGICQKQFMILLEAGALRHVNPFDYYRSAAFEAERRQKKAAGESVPPPKKPEPAVVAVPVAEPAKLKLSRAEREARRDARRERLAAEQARDRAEMEKRGVRFQFGDDSNRHKGKGGDKKGGKGKRR